MNVSSLATVEQIREFLKGTADVTFANPADEATRRTFVTNVIGVSQLQPTKGQRGVLFANSAASDGIHNTGCVSGPS